MPEASQPRPAAGRRAPWPGPPGGWWRLAREIVVFCGAYWLYRLVRGLVADDRAAALASARWIVDAERALGVYPEPALNAWAAAHAPVAAVAAWAYLHVHFVVTSVALGWLYLRHRDRFGAVRNAFCVAMGLALVLYLVVPTAPPRLLPGAGYADLVQQRTGVPDAAATLYNPYAAIPSMHVAFALLLTWAWAPLSRGAGRAAWLAYPPLVTAVTVLTGNHFWLDAAAGVAVATVGVGVVQVGFWRAWPARAQRQGPSPTG